MKTIVLLFIAELFYCSVCAQECEPMLIELGIDNLNHPNLFKTADGNYMIFADQSSGSTPDRNIMLRKINLDGTEIWTKYYGDTLLNEIKVVKQLSNGEFVIVITNSHSGLLSSAIARIDQQGNELWSFNKKDTVFTDFVEEQNGDIDFCGYISKRICLLKTDHSGNIQLQSSAFYNPQYESGYKPYCISLDNDNNIHLGVFAGYNIFSRFHELGELYWIKYNNSFSAIHIVKISKIDYDVDEPFRIIIHKSGIIDYWCKPGVPGYDASASLFKVYQLDSTGNSINEAGYSHCGNSITDLSIEKDSSYLIIGTKCLYRFDDQFNLKSRSTFSRDYYSGISGYLNTIVKDNANQYTIINFINNKPNLIRYSYFGDDCLTQICGRVFTDVNRNCVADSSDQNFIAGSLGIPGNCLDVYSDSLGNYCIQAEYGLNYLVVEMDNELYESSCNKLDPDTVRVKYPVKKEFHDMAVFKKNSCFLPYSYFSTTSNNLPGGFCQTNFSLYNKADSALYNFEIKLVKDKRLSLLNSNKPFTLSNDTLIFFLDTLKKGTVFQLIMFDSIPCNTVFGDKLCMDLFLSGKDPCKDTSYTKTFSACLGVSDISNGYINNIVSYSVGRPCERSQLIHEIYNTSSSSLYNVKVELKRDPGLINLYTSHPYLNQSGIWQFTLDSIRSNGRIDLIIIDSISCNAMLGDNYCFVWNSEHFNKCENHLQSKKDSFCVKLSNSHDPNYVDSKIHNFFECFFKGDSTVSINYTIHFQNTGNDTAFHVKVYDTLSPVIFDLNSLILKNSSHSFVSKMINDSIIEFDFENINLLSSQLNEAKSQGFVSFSVSARTKFNKYGNYEAIRNRANIFFDRNSGILTDWNYIWDCGFTVITQDKFHKISLTGIFLYPNPAKSIIFIGNEESLSENAQASLFSNLGTKIINFNRQQMRQGLSIENLENGSYFLVIKDKQEMVVLRLIIMK